MGKKKVLLLAIVLPLFLGVMFALGLYIKHKNPKMAAGPDILPPNSIDVANAAGPTALLVKESGTVTYKLPESSEVVTLEQDEINVPSGTTVKTGADTFAHVIFPNNSLMSLSKDTEVVLNYEENSIKIFQLLGNTWHRVEKVLQGASYEVETPNTLATVRGTEFNVGILPNNESEVYVLESVVDVSKIAKENGTRTVKETQKVEKDKHIFIPPSETTDKMKLVDLPNNKKDTDWFKRNIKMTEKIKEAEVEKESKEKEDPAATSVPIDTDSIKRNVRKEFMEKIKDDEDIKKIDESFGIRRNNEEQKKPTSTPTPTPKRESQNSSFNQSSVLGARTSNETFTKDPTKAPADTPKPTATFTLSPTPKGVFEIAIVNVKEQRSNERLINTLVDIKAAKDFESAQRILKSIPQTVFKTDNKDEAYKIKSRLEEDGAIVEIKSSNSK